MSAWGKSWGYAFGAAFGAVVAVTPVPYSGGGGYVRADESGAQDAQDIQLQIQQEDEIIILAVARMLTSGTLG